MRHINEPPPPLRDKRPDVSPRLEAAVQKAMAKDPADRFPTMVDFCQELEACLAEARSATTEGTQVIAPAPRHRPRRSTSFAWPVVLVIAALIAIGIVIAALVLDRGTNVFSIHNGKAGTGAATGGAVRLSAINAYDPFGNPPGQEHNSAAPLATDGKGATYWETENYHDSFQAIGKKGVGLIFDAHRDVQLHEFGIATSTPGFTAVVRAGDSPTGPFDATVSAPVTVQTDTHVPITGSKYHYYLLWITSLPPGQGTVRINEVKAA
jgi:hypothetical protein